jgi:uncharacterized damage-inducible protein DinB
MATALETQITPEFAVATRDFTVANIEREMPITKRVIESIPEDKKTWKPDEKARTAEELAWHVLFSEVAMLRGIAALRFNTPEEDMAQEKDRPATVAEIANWYEENLPKALDGVKKLTAQQLLTPVDFYGAFNFPSFMYLGFVTSHSIHHRGWLASYLRPMGSKVPSIYGGSADEPWQSEMAAD